MTGDSGQESKGLVFDWHAESKLDRNSLLVWLVINALGSGRASGQADLDMERLSKLTDKFTKCHLTMYLNGVELNVKAFLEGITFGIEHSVQTEVARLVAEVELDKMQEALDEAQEAVQMELRRRLADVGLTVKSWEG